MGSGDFAEKVAWDDSSLRNPRAFAAYGEHPAGSHVREDHAGVLEFVQIIPLVLGFEVEKARPHDAAL